MPPFQFSKPTKWNIHTNYIRGTYNGAAGVWYEYAVPEHAISDMHSDAYFKSHLEQCLWQVIRKPDEPPRLKFLSYIPSIHTTWDS